MKKLRLLLTFIIISSTAKASTVLASSFGYNSTNATAAFQAAIQSSNDTIVVDYQSSDWNVGPSIFFNLTNKVIIFQPNVRLKAIAGAFNSINACLIEFKYCDGIQVIGYQAEFKMNKAEYALLNDSEFRMSINIHDSKNITIKGLTLNESGGDGIYVGGDGLGYCENILIEDVICINHYRQGMSITNVQNMTVKHCRFANTKGTLPEAGVDVEPYQINQRIINLQFEKCSFEGNGWAGLALALFELNSTSLPVSISVKDCYFKNNSLPTNTYAHCEIFVSADKDIPVQGSVLFERCFIDGSQYSAFYTRKTSEAYSVKFKDCVFQNISQQQIQYNEPIFLEVPSYTNPSGYLGGLEFENVLISYATNFSFFRVYGWATLQGIKDIVGNFTVVEPNNNPVFYSNVASAINANYTFTNQTSLPLTTVNLNAIETKAIECSQQPGIFSVARTSSLNNYPIGINYTNTGTVIFGDDVHQMTKGIVIPANQNSTTEAIIARLDSVTEISETIDISLNSNLLYSLGTNNTLSLQAIDCIATPNNDEINLIMYPNPATSTLNLLFKNSFLEIGIYNTLGQVVHQQKIVSQNQLSIDVSNYQAGMYFLKIVSGNTKKEKTFKFVKQ